MNILQKCFKLFEVREEYSIFAYTEIPLGQYLQISKNELQFSPFLASEYENNPVVWH